LRLTIVHGSLDAKVGHAYAKEQIAQIEVALRRRFFPFVAKVITPDRAGWIEEQHDNDRLSRSLAAYAPTHL
jgi:hypothetical protein